MRTAGFVAICLVSLLALSGVVQACAGADSGKVYLDEKLTAEPGEHAKKSFQIKDPENVYVSVSGNCSAFLLNDDEMQKYENGENYTVEAKRESDSDRFGRVKLGPGMYWIVIENDEGANPVTATVDVARPGEECGGPGPFIPNFQFVTGVAAMGMVVLICSFLRNRKF